MPQGMHVKLTPLHALSADGRNVVGDALGQLDVPVAGQSDGRALVAHQLDRAPFTSWSVLRDNMVAGVFAIAPTVTFPGVETSVYITPGHRRKGVNTAIYRAAITAARDCRIDLSACVALDNTDSLAAHHSLFQTPCPTDTNPTGEWIRYRINEGDLPEGWTDPSLVETVTIGLQEARAVWNPEALGYR